MDNAICGVILRTIPYQDTARILTVFSACSGVMSFFIKGLSQKKSHLLSLTEPFNEVEIHYRKGRSDLLFLTDLSGINSNPHLRERLSSLKAASKLTEAILHSQLPGKPASPLYLLLTLYLKHIPFFEDPSILTTSFYLKLLRHEGLLVLSPACGICNARASFLDAGESFCSLHASKNAHRFSQEEWSLLETLAHAGHFESLKKLHLPAHFPTWAEQYLKEHTKH